MRRSFFATPKLLLNRSSRTTSSRSTHPVFRVFCAAATVVTLAACFAIFRNWYRVVDLWAQWSATCTADVNLGDAELLPSPSFLHCEAPEASATPSEEARGLPRVYILPSTAALVEPRDPPFPALCSEQDFHRQLARNRTGSLVAEEAAADLIFVPFYGSCRPRDELRRSSQAARRGLERALAGSARWRRHGGADFFAYVQRHYTERVSLAQPLRQLVDALPLTWLVPEYNSLDQADMHSGRGVWWWARTVLVPQPPVLSRILDHPHGPGAPYEQAAPARRPFKFAFVGGVVNRERRVLVAALAGRGDVVVRAACPSRRFRVQNEIDLEAAYAASDFCLVPHGDARSSRRLHDALRMGCLPVLSDSLYVLPFANQIEYKQFVFRVELPAEGAGGEEGAAASVARQLEALARIPEEVLRERRGRALEAARMSAFEDCTYARGMELTLQEVALRWRAMQPLLAAPYGVSADVGLEDS